MAERRGEERKHQMVAMQRVFGMYPIDGSTDGRGLWGSYQLSPHVRVIVLDASSSDRSYGRAEDDPVNPKDFLGQTQTQWFKDTLAGSSGLSVTLNIVVCAKTWIGEEVTGEPVEQDADKVWAYSNWRQSFADWLTDYNTANPGAPINLVWMGGDRHFIGYDDGTANIWGGFPSWVGSGWSAKGLELRDGEDYLVHYNGHRGDGDDFRYVMQYLRGTIVDDAQKVTLTGSSGT